MNLIIVESPNKIKTIKSYLSDDYEVMASYGHLREMSRKKGYDPQTFQPNWEVIQDGFGHTAKNKIISKIISVAKKADKIYLATDPDREGEAIAWHIYDMLPKAEQDRSCRITFNEITKNAIVSAIDNAHELDMNLVNSQFARRVIDRLIGYKLSTFVRYTVRAKSAGRVQSVALMFIVNRQLERDKFVPSFWYEITGKLENGLDVSYFDHNNKYQKYIGNDSSSSYKFKFANEKDANEVYNQLGDQYKCVEMLEPKITTGDKYTPLTTDKLLQLAGNIFGWSAAKTTLVAQKLFEGVELSNGKHMAYITYPRTDSNRMNDDFIKSSKKFISDNFGSQYIDYNFNNNNSKNSKKNVQDAHEAIRPVDCNITPQDIKKDVDSLSYKLYNLIWSRTMASLMTRPQYEINGMIFENNGHMFYGMNKTIKHDGYLVLDFYRYLQEKNTQVIPQITLNNSYNGDLKVNKFEKLPPAYFTQASLIAALKESGVGRPSTYATMAKIGETRGYVNQEKQKLIPTEMGMKVINELQKGFSDVINAEFTSQMESNLDKIASGEEEWTQYLSRFAPEFEEKLKHALEESAINKKNSQVSAERDCPKCGSPLLVKESRFGNKFVACSDFPRCRYAEFDEIDNKTGEMCPTCGKELVKRYNKNSQMFIGCSGYPECHYIKKEN